VNPIGAGPHLVAVKAFLLQVPCSKPRLVDAHRLSCKVFPGKPAVAEALQDLPAARTADAVVIARLFTVVAIHKSGLLYTLRGAK
jgi:hypothetical protein